MSDLEDDLLRQMNERSIMQPIREYTFASQDLGRLWRFDFAWPHLKYAVEVDGGTRSGGRHNRPMGIESDIEKLNEAVLLGWTVIRVTSTMIKNGEAVEFVRLGMLAARFWRHVTQKADPDACWLWSGPVTLNGYGIVCQSRKQTLAHRLVFELAGIPLDPNLTIDHLCRQKLCVRISHLEEVTRAENTRRTAGSRETCKKAGHPLRRTRSGNLWCPQCQRDRRAAKKSPDFGNDIPTTFLEALVRVSKDIVTHSTPVTSGRMSVPAGWIRKMERLLVISEQDSFEIMSGDTVDWTRRLATGTDQGNAV